MAPFLPIAFGLAANFGPTTKFEHCLCPSKDLLAAWPGVTRQLGCTQAAERKAKQIAMPHSCATLSLESCPRSQKKTRPVQFQGKHSHICRNLPKSAICKPRLSDDIGDKSQKATRKTRKKEEKKQKREERGTKKTIKKTQAHKKTGKGHQPSEVSIAAALLRRCLPPGLGRHEASARPQLGQDVGSDQPQIRVVT